MNWPIRPRVVCVIASTVVRVCVCEIWFRAMSIDDFMTVTETPTQFARLSVSRLLHLL